MGRPVCPKGGNVVTGEVNAYSRVNGGQRQPDLPLARVQRPIKRTQPIATPWRIRTASTGSSSSRRVRGQAGKPEKWSSRLRNSSGEFLTRCATSAESTGAGVPNGVSYGAIGGEMAISTTRSVVEMPVPGGVCRRVGVQAPVHPTGIAHGRRHRLVELLINGSAGTQYIQLQPRSDAPTTATSGTSIAALRLAMALCLRFTNNAASNTIRVKAMGIVGIERSSVVSGGSTYDGFQ